MFTRKLKVMLVSTMFASAVVLANNWHKINENSVSEELNNKILAKEKNILKLMQRNYGLTLDIPLIITNELETNVYGITICEQDGSIKIYLNKNIVQNNIDYVINTVMPHEYAHALMFKQKLLAKNRDGYALRIKQVGLSNKRKYNGHNHIWKKTCKKLGGNKCQKFVTHKDAQMSNIFQ